MDVKEMRIIVSAGGTGGHIYPALAIIHKIKEKEPNSEILYIGTKDRMESTIIPNQNIPYFSIDMKGLNRKNPFKNISVLKNYAKNIKILKKEIKRFNPDIVIGVGGYVTAPVIYSAKKLGYKTFIHEQNSIPGLSNKFLSHYADKIGVSLIDSISYFPKEKVVYTGNPRSEEAYYAKEVSKKELGLSLSDTKKLVLIVMGSLGSTTMNQKLKDTLPLFKNKDYEVVFVTGKGYYEEYKPGSSLVEYGLKPFNPDGTETNESDLVRQKKMDNKFGGGVFSLNYTGNRLTASLGGGLNQYRGNNFGKVTWVKNYIGNLSPEHEYYRNKSKKTDGNIYLKANYDLTSTLSAYADLQYRHIDYTIDGVNDKYDWNKNALRPLAVDKKFDFFNPKVGLNWNITPNHRLYASFSVAQKEPTRNNYTDGDPDSYPKAEKLLDYEAGYTFANPWLTAGANFYYMDYTDQLVLTGALNDIGEALTENIPDSYRMGIELMLGIKPCKWFQWDINATWSKNRIKDFVESLPGYHYNADETVTSLPTVLIKHKDTHIAFSPDFLLNNRFSFNYKGFEASLQSQFVSKQYMTNAEVEELTLDKYFVSNLNLAYTFRPKKILKEVTLGFTVYNLFNEEYENNGWASSDYTDTVENRGNYAGYAAQAGTNVLGHVSFRF